MKRKLIIHLIAAGVLLALLVIGIGLTRLFYSPGARFWGKAAHFELSASCYVLDTKNNLEFVQETPVMLCGNYDGKPYNGGEGSFRGFIDVRDYSIPISEAAIMLRANDNRGMPATACGEYLTINYHGIKTYNDNAPNTQSDYSYLLFLNPKAPRDFMIIVYAEQSVYAVVNADSLEQARTIYDAYTAAYTAKYYP